MPPFIDDIFRRRIATFLLVLVGLWFANAVRVTWTAQQPDFEAGCDGGESYFVAACLGGYARDISTNPYDDAAPSMILGLDTPADDPQYRLARYDQTGAVFGAAYGHGTESVYVAAYHKRQLPFGPGGPGAVYRIDLGSGEVELFASVPNVGPAQHEPKLKSDDGAAAWVGKTSLGDLEISADGRELLVVNLDDRRIYRIAVGDGRILGSFAHGAIGEDWAVDARPFGLAVHGGHVYHAVVDSAESSGGTERLRGFVYRSRTDGTGMTEVASFPLDYRRVHMGSQWQGWEPWGSPRGGPMPLITDLVFDDHDHLVVGLRDVRADRRLLVNVNGSHGAPFVGPGDLLRGVPTGDRWRFEGQGEFYEDDGSTGEGTYGGLAALGRPNRILVGMLGSADPKASLRWTGVATWLDAESGNVTAIESICEPRGLLPYDRMVGGRRHAFAHSEPPPRQPRSRRFGELGDVEVLCESSFDPPTATPRPEPTATPTSRQPTATPPPSPSPTPSVTSSPTPTRAPLYLPLLLREQCRSIQERADVVLVLDTSSSMAGDKLVDAQVAAATFVRAMDLAPERDQVAVVRFDETAEVVHPLGADRAVVLAAIEGLRPRSGTRIDRGLDRALAELLSERHIAANQSVVVVMTDGQQSGGLPSDPNDAARRAREAGVVVYTIGLGDDVDGPMLIAMAGARVRYRYAPDSGALEAIYAEVARDIRCPEGSVWPGKR